MLWSLWTAFGVMQQPLCGCLSMILSSCSAFVSSLIPVLRVIVGAALGSGRFTRAFLGDYGCACQDFCSIVHPLFINVWWEKVPRTFSQDIHETSLNILLQSGYIDIGSFLSDEKNVFLPRDNSSSYCWVYICADATKKFSSKAIINCCADSGVPKMYMSDGPTHFKNDTMRGCRRLNVPHSFTLPYFPWTSEVLERLGKNF